MLRLAAGEYAFLFEVRIVGTEEVIKLIPSQFPDPGSVRRGERRLGTQNVRRTCMMSDATSGNYRRGHSTFRAQANTVLEQQRNHAGIPSSRSCLPLLRISVFWRSRNPIATRHGRRASPGLGFYTSSDFETYLDGSPHHRVVGEHLLLLRPRDGVLERI